MSGREPVESVSLRRIADGWRLEQVQTIARPLDDVFPFFEAPENLESITPSWLRFSIRTPSPVPMHVGARIDYRLALFGVPLWWRTRIVAHEPGRSFVDVQESGPFALWRHVHEFRAEGRATVMQDRVDFRAPLGPIGRVAERLIVGR
jgi:ligand-binding SRPBCC domain-containing protein